MTKEDDMDRVISDGSIALREIEEAEALAQIEHEYADLPESVIALGHSDANGIVRRIAEARREIELIGEQEAEEIARIRARAAELKQAWEARIAWLDERYGESLKAFAAANLEGKKVRSIKLLSGVVGFRKNPSSLAIVDKDAALEWAKANLPDAIKVVESVGVSPLKLHVEATGESLEFAEYTPAFDKFYIEAE